MLNRYEFTEKTMQFLNSQAGPILMLCNAENTWVTEDTIEIIKEYWEEHGFDERLWVQTQIVDKGYGYLRG
jgi:hypothetical protein